MDILKNKFCFPLSLTGITFTYSTGGPDNAHDD